jgi:hypothetical protein
MDHDARDARQQARDARLVARNAAKENDKLLKELGSYLEPLVVAGNKKQKNDISKHYNDEVINNTINTNTLPDFPGNGLDEAFLVEAASVNYSISSGQDIAATKQKSVLFGNVTLHGQVELDQSNHLRTFIIPTNVCQQHMRFLLIDISSMTFVNTPGEENINKISDKMQELLKQLSGNVNDPKFNNLLDEKMNEFVDFYFEILYESICTDENNVYDNTKDNIELLKQLLEDEILDPRDPDDYDQIISTCIEITDNLKNWGAIVAGKFFQIRKVGSGNREVLFNFLGEEANDTPLDWSMTFTNTPLQVPATSDDCQQLGNFKSLIDGQSPAVYKGQKALFYNLKNEFPAYKTRATDTEYLITNENMYTVLAEKGVQAAIILFQNCKTVVTKAESGFVGTEVNQRLARLISRKYYKFLQAQQQKNLAAAAHYELIHNRLEVISQQPRRSTRQAAAAAERQTRAAAAAQYYFDYMIHEIEKRRLELTGIYNLIINFFKLDFVPQLLGGSKPKSKKSKKRHKNKSKSKRRNNRRTYKKKARKTKRRRY